MRKKNRKKNISNIIHHYFCLYLNAYTHLQGIAKTSKVFSLGNRGYALSHVSSTKYNVTYPQSTEKALKLLGDPDGITDCTVLSSSQAN